MIGINRGLWLTAAAAMVFAVGCGDTSSGTDAGNGCSTDANCGTGKACHPVLKECVSTCTGSSDCPASEKTCDVINGSTAKFCKCSTDALCNTAVAGNVCSTATFQCKAKCTANTNCPTGYTCDTTSGQCKGGSTDGGSDAGTDAGVDAGTDAGVTCSTANPQPDACRYGEACFQDMTCGALVDGACVNVAQAIAAGRHNAFSGATSTGNIIYVHTETNNETDGCSDPNDVPFRVTLYAYAAPGTTFNATDIRAWPGFKYIKADGTTQDIPGVLVGNTSFPFANYAVTNSGKNAQVTLTLCGAAGSTTIGAAFAFTNGNGYCAQLTR